MCLNILINYFVRRPTCVAVEIGVLVTIGSRFVSSARRAESQVLSRGTPGEPNGSGHAVPPVRGRRAPTLGRTRRRCPR